MTNSASGRTTLISPGTTVRGDITFTGHLDIEGEVNGSIQAEPGQDAILRVVEGGKVAGEVKVPHAMINGKVEGDIHATERLELAERAVVDGDVYYNLIEMAVGAKVNGGLRHTSNVADDLAAKREAKATETIPNPTPNATISCSFRKPSGICCLRPPRCFLVENGLYQNGPQGARRHDSGRSL